MELTVRFRPGVVIERIREHAERGKLEEAVNQLNLYLSNAGLAPEDRAGALLLYGRCQLGLLASAQALIALDEAADIYRSLGNEELKEYCRALRLRHSLDERDNKAVLQATERLTRLCDENGWPLARSVAMLYTGLTQSEQRQYSDAARCYLEYIGTDDPLRLPWEVALAVQSLKNAVIRGGLDTGLLEGCADALELTTNPGVPRLFIMDQIQHVVALLSEQKLEQAREALVSLRAYLDRCGAEWAGRLRFITMVENNLGYVYQHLYRHEEAITHYENAINLARERGLLYSEHLALFNKGVVLLWSRKPGEAIDCIRRSQRNYSEQQDYVSQLSRYYLAAALLVEGNNSTALATWGERRQFETNAETIQAMSSFSALLKHLFLDDPRQPAEAVETARAWLREITPGV